MKSILQRFQQTLRPIRRKHAGDPRCRPWLEALEDRLAPASYTWNATTGILSISLGTSESLTVTNNGGTRLFALSPGAPTFTQVGGDMATGSGGPTLSFAAADNIGTGVTINNVGAGAGTNDVTFSGIGSTDSLTSAGIIVDIGAAAAPSGTIAFSGGFDILATSTISLTTIRNISVGSGSTLSGGASISLSANRKALATSGVFTGIDINGGTITTSGTGNILLQGRGGDAILGLTSDHGINVHNGGLVQSTAAGAVAGKITLDGIGGPGGDANLPAWGVVISSAAVNSVDGDILLHGQGGAGGNAYGVDMESGQVQATGKAKITLDGTGGSTGYEGRGVVITGGGLVSAVDGDILIRGRGIGNGLGNGGIGVTMGNESQVLSTGLAKVTIDGTGGNGANAGQGANYGVTIEGRNTLVSSVTGDILVQGQGGTSGSFNLGVYLLHGATISSTGVAKVTVTGTGGAGTTSNHGVEIEASDPGDALVTSSVGDILITGQGGGTAAGTSSSNFGVDVRIGGRVSSTGTAKITIDGTGGNGAASNHGVVIREVNTLVTSVDGDVAITGQPGAGSDAFGIRVISAASVTSTGAADATFASNSMDIDATAVINVGSGNSMTLKQRSNGTTINLGGADVAATLGLIDAELDRVTAGTLIIGDVNSGTLTVSADISRATATSIRLISAGDVVISGGQVNTGGGTVLLHPGASPAAVKPTHAGTDLTASTVSFASDLAFNIAGTTVDSQYNQLNVSGTVNLTGVTLKLSGAYVPVQGDVFTIVSATSRTGLFAGLADNAEVTFNGKRLRVNYTSTTVTLTTLAGDIVTAPDLKVSVSAGVASITPGSTLTFTLSYRNVGNQGASGVTLTETLPTGTTFNAGASTAGWTETAPGSHVFKLAVGGLVGGSAVASAHFVVTVNNPAAAAQIEVMDTASIADDGANGPYPTLGNNSATARVSLTQPVVGLARGVVAVPVQGLQQVLTITFVSRSAAYRSELGFFLVDDPSGRIGVLQPGDPGYAAAALSRRHVVFNRYDRPGTVRRLILPSGAFLAFYLVQNSTSQVYLTRSAGRQLAHRPQVFFSIPVANVDHFDHVRWLSVHSFGYEDLYGGGDKDFNDLVTRIAFALPKPTAAKAPAIHTASIGGSW